MTLVLPNAEQEVVIRKALNENPDTTLRDVELIQEWLLEEPLLPDAWDEECVVSFLRGCRFDLDKCKQRLEKYFTVKAAFPEFYSNRDIRRTELRKICDIADAAILPNLTPDGRRLTIARAAMQDFQTPNIPDLIKIAFMGVDLRMKMDKGVLGDIYIGDANFPVARHLFSVNPIVLKKALDCVQDALPLIISEVHIINAPSFAETIFNIIKPFLSEGLRNCVHIHSTVETLYEYVPQEFLPEEYGGQGGKLLDLKNEWIAKMEEFTTWFEEQESVKAHESTKDEQLSTYTGIFGYEGTFMELISGKFLSSWFSSWF